MHNRIIPCFILIGLVYGCAKKESGAKLAPPGNQHYSVLTQHNDNTRAGFDSLETSLTTLNVTAAQFGKLFILPVDDQVCAQPLVVANLSVAGKSRNVVFVATVNNSVYAFDGDSGTLCWKKNFTPAGMRPPNAGDMSSGWCHPYTNLTSNIGIVGTPVIDSAGQTMYLVARSTDGAHFAQYLHAINITNGSEQGGSPVLIAATVAGSGDGNVNNQVSFDPLRNNQRMGLALVNGVVYISYSSHCDWNPYHGWIIGYSARTLQQTIVYNDTPDGENGGIWESGQGIVADAQGNLYVTTGNGTVGQGDLYTPSSNGTNETVANPDPTNVRDRAESALKLTPSGNTLQVSSYFTPTSYVSMNTNDQDYGSLGTLIIPNSNYYLTGAKDGNIYLLDKDNMGGYSSSGNQVQQTIHLNSEMHCQPAYYRGSSSESVFIWGENDKLRAFPFNRSSNLLSPGTASSASGPTGGSGAELAVSSNRSASGTGIVWASYATGCDAEGATCPGILRAFDANDITRELWNSNLSTADNVGNFAKFCAPTIANGHVYLATFSNQVAVYGLK